MLVTLPLHHVILRLPKKSMLRAEKRCQPEKLAVVPFEDMRGMLPLGRNRCRMEQRAYSRVTKFFRPKFAQVIEWKFDRHQGLVS